MRNLILIALLGAMFTHVSAQEEKKPCACCEEEYRQFDFWVGDWNTYGPKGQLVGTNNIVLMQDNCVIQENWRSEGFPYTGTSYNFYDAESKKWNQVWVDNQGGHLKLSGGFKGGSMILMSAAQEDEEGTVTFNRITWTPNEDGSVRQFWELVTRNEPETKVLFDGLYKKKE